jgi:tRNA pseudouridine55 synthase
VLLLDKPLGLSSNQALQKVKWLLRAEKAGHTGTLDPLATGVLPLCFGAATKFGQAQLDADKTYEAVARLGARTSTGDAEGEVIEERAVQVTAQDLVRVAAQFTGAIRQIPPMHSALKKDGKALYEYARAGVEVERAPRNVTVFRLDIAPVDAVSIRIVARVSKGTYIRTLAEDIGQALGCGAHLTALRRVATGGFEVSRCITLQALEAMDEARRLACLLPVQSLIPDHARVVLDAQDAGRFLSGLRRRGAWADAEAVAVFAPSPASEGGLGTGPGNAGIRATVLNERCLPPSQPSPASGGRSASQSSANGSATQAGVDMRGGLVPSSSACARGLESGPGNAGICATVLNERRLPPSQPSPASGGRSASQGSANGSAAQAEVDMRGGLTSSLACRGGVRSSTAASSACGGRLGWGKAALVQETAPALRSPSLYPLPHGGERKDMPCQALAPHPNFLPSGEREKTVFLGTARIHSGEMIPARLLNPIEIEQILSSPITP